MARPVVGDVRVKIENRPQKNGCIYVYERQVRYDPESRTNKTLSRKLRGIKYPGSDTIVETRSKRKPDVEVKTVDSEGKHVILRKKIGCLSLLEWVGLDSGIDQDIKTAFGEDNELALRCINIARYWVATNGMALPNIRTWQIKHSIPGDNLITENMYRKVFDDIGLHEDYTQNYFKCRCNELSKRSVIAIYSTTTSTYSQQLDPARYGFNKDEDGLPTIKTLTLYSLDAHQPLAFYLQPGNIPDIISIKNALKELSFLKIEKPLIVSDNGFYSQDNICDFLLEHMKFLVRITTYDGKWIRDIIDEHLPELELFGNQLKCDPDIRGVSVTFNHEFKCVRKYNTAGHKAGEQITFTRRLCMHIYRIMDKKRQDDKQFASELAAIQNRILADEPLNASSQKLADKCLTVTRRKDKITIKTNEDGCANTSKYFGLLMLITNDEKDKKTALTIYRKREHIEDHYEKLKNIADGNKPRVWDDWRYKGRQFVQFVCLGYYDYLYKKISELKKTLGVPNNDPVHDLKDNLKLEQQVKTWLENKSLHEILDWFDCVETVNLYGGKHPHVCLITEHVRRDVKFLEVLGYYGILNKS